MRCMAKLRSDIRIWNNRRRTLITIRWKRGLLRLVIHEKYERLTKWLLRTLALIGIVSSIGFLPVWYLNVVFAVALVAIEQFFERAVFLYTIIYCQPLPKFNWNIGEEWVAMGFAYPVDAREGELNVVGPVFKSKHRAHEFFELLREWNYGEKEDQHDNICLSFIYDELGGYYTYIYPNLARYTVREAFSDIEEVHKLGKFGKEAEELVFQFIFCKNFSPVSHSQLDEFARRQSKDLPFWFQPFIQNPDGSLQILFSEQPILKHHFKIKRRHDLVRHEVEYHHFIHVIDVK